MSFFAFGLQLFRAAEKQGTILKSNAFGLAALQDFKYPHMPRSTALPARRHDTQIHQTPFLRDLAHLNLNT
jgi:hypothetical protein